jgi:hypothetical protein
MKKEIKQAKKQTIAISSHPTVDCEAPASSNTFVLGSPAITVPTSPTTHAPRETTARKPRALAHIQKDLR